MRAGDHRCDLPDLDYSDVEQGYIRCTICPRQWVLMVKLTKEGRKFARWIPQPCPGCNRQPCACYRPKAKSGGTKERWGDDD